MVNHRAVLDLVAEKRKILFHHHLPSYQELTIVYCAPFVYVHTSICPEVSVSLWYNMVPYHRRMETSATILQKPKASMCFFITQ
jgi:hypothetical protein